MKRVHVVLGTVLSQWAVLITQRIRATCGVTPGGDEGPSLGCVAALPQLREKFVCDCGTEVCFTNRPLKTEYACTCYSNQTSEIFLTN